MMKPDNYVHKIEDFRKHKDHYFGSHQDSPIPSEQREKFKGLEYFPVDPQFHVLAKMTELEKKEKLEMQASDGAKIEYIRWVKFTFKIGDNEVVLNGYKSDPHDDHIFVPFRDATSGKETYGAGRYLEVEHHEHNTGEWILDFNMAYNPYCSYSPHFSCPLTPPENWLDIPIRAGEKVPKELE